MSMLVFIPALARGEVGWGIACPGASMQSRFPIPQLIDSSATLVDRKVSLGFAKVLSGMSIYVIQVPWGRISRTKLRGHVSMMASLDPDCLSMRMMNQIR